MKVYLFSCIASLLLLTGLNPAYAAQIAVPAFADGEIDSAGVLGVTVKTAEPSIRTLRSGNANIHHGAFVFDISSLPDVASISSIAFEVTTAELISNTSETATVEFHGYASDAAIDAADFDSPISSVGTLLASETFAAGAGTSPPIGSVLSIPLAVEAFQSVLDGSDTYMTLRSETVNFVNFHIHSLENVQGAAPPTLVVNTESVPEPNSFALMLPMLGLMGIFRRRCVRPRRCV